MKLGSQIQSHSINPNLDKGNAALRQIHNREELYKIGQQEAEDEKNGELKIRTVIHPRNLGGLLNDLSDPRVSRERILEDYQLDSNFLTELGDRFRLATQMAIIEEEAKDGEIMVQNTAPSSSGDSVTPPSNNGKMVKQEYDENGSLNEVDPERLKTLKNRLGMDDEVDELPRR